MGKLWASAIETEDDWVPNYQAVQKNFGRNKAMRGISRTTLRNWWDKRDRSRDRHFKTLQTNARTKVAAEGAEDQIKGYLGAVSKRFQDLLEDDDAWKMPGDKRAKALMDVSRTVGLLNQLVARLDPPDDTAIGSEDDADRLDDALGD